MEIKSVLRISGVGSGIPEVACDVCVTKCAVGGSDVSTTDEIHERAMKASGGSSRGSDRTFVMD